MIITISEDGTARCVYTDAFPLRDLGTLSVKRASTIEFNEDRWEVRLASAPGVVAFSHQSRAECLAWEHQQVETTL